MPAPSLITFDIFGTVLDWRSGLMAGCEAAGRPLAAGEFDRVIDAQGEMQQGQFQPYAEITRLSLVRVLGLDEARAAAIAGGLPDWPFFNDAPVLRALLRVAPCGAMTNSDREHGVALQARLGFTPSLWLCAEDVRLYKPDPGFWHHMARASGVTLGPAWWHVSAYADYDLRVAQDLGLTTVFVRRPHARPGPAAHAVDGLAALLALLG
jgi:2-haloalkanoic acid dehalogenase type II